MKLGYEYYRNNLIKLAILAVPLTFAFWDFFTGKDTKNEPGAIYLLLFLGIGGAAFLMWQMRRTSRADAMPAQNTSKLNKASTPPKDLSDRFLGIFGLIGSTVLAYLFIVSPLLSAARHEKDVSLSLEGVVVVPVLFIMGATCLALGEKSRSLLGRRQASGERRMPSTLGYVIFLAAFLCGFGLYLWMQFEMSTYGYQFTI